MKRQSQQPSLHKLHMPAQPKLLVLGHITRDTIGEQTCLGGAAAFAARTAATLGVPTTLITATTKDSSGLLTLQHEPLIHLRVQPSRHETAFYLDYSGPTRQITLQTRANNICPEAIDPQDLKAQAAYVAPVIGECLRNVVNILTMQHVVVGAQGWLRQVNKAGLLVPSIADELINPPPHITAMVFSELDHPEAEDIAKHLAQQSIVVALTRGAQGATLFSNNQRDEIAAANAIEVDPTGAGDVFGVVLTLALQQGCHIIDAGKLAAYAAARVVEGPGLGNLNKLKAYPWQANHLYNVSEESSYHAHF